MNFTNKSGFARFAQALILAILALCVAKSTLAEEPRYFAIRNAHIVTVSGPDIKNGTVVIAKGLIVAVGENVTIPPEAWVIDGSHLTVYPGFIDALSDLGLGAAAPPGSAGGGGVRGRGQAQPGQTPSQGPQDRPATTPWLNAADELKPDDKRIETWRDGGFTTALATPMTGFFAGQGAVINLAGDRASEMVVAAPASLYVTLRTQGFVSGFPDSLMGALSNVRQVYLDAKWYEGAEATYAAHPQGVERPPYDRTEIAIGEAIRAGRPVLLPGNIAAEIHRSVELANRIDERAVIYGVQQGYLAADELAAAKLPVLVNLKWPEKEKDADPDEEDSLRVLRFRDRAPSSPAVLQKAGVKFAFYLEDASSPKDALKNAKKAIDAGLPADAAVRAFTLNAAEILGVSDRLGSIEVGKIADLVVTDGDPFKESTKVKMTFVDGRRYEVHETARPTEAPTIRLTGKWKLNVTTPHGTQEGTADLNMTPDGTVTGSVTGTTGNIMGSMGTLSITDGWTSGNKFSFVITVPKQGTPTQVTFSGTVEGGQMKGTASSAGFTVDFTGTRPDSVGGPGVDQEAE